MGFIRRRWNLRTLVCLTLQFIDTPPGKNIDLWRVERPLFSSQPMPHTLEVKNSKTLRNQASDSRFPTLQLPLYIDS
jgi:hypothetical protein